MQCAHWSRRRVLTFAALLAPMVGRSSFWGEGGAAATPSRQAADAGSYTAYVPVPGKQGQFAQYTCEFDAAWMVLKSFDRDVPLEEQVAILGMDTRIEPHVEEETLDGAIIHGGDITQSYSGDYTQSYLARTTGQAMRKVFAYFDLDVTPVATRDEVEAALDAGAPVWMKTTVDFQPWQPVTWVTPDDKEVPGVYGNDHAVVAIGYNDDVVVIRDALGPTSTNWDRAYEYEVSWEAFLAAWEGQAFDGLAVSPPA